MKKTVEDIMRLLCKEVAGNDRAEAMLESFKRDVLPANRLQVLNEEVSEEYYQEAVRRIPQETPALLRYCSELFQATSPVMFHRN